MFQNQVNQIPLIVQDQQQVTVEQSFTFSIKCSCSITIKFLIDVVIFTTLLLYQYGLIDFFLPYSRITIIYTELHQWFHFVMCVLFIWSNLGCGYSYRNSRTLKRFHYIMLFLSLVETIKYTARMYMLDKLQSIPSFIYIANKDEVAILVLVKIIATIILAISICYKR